MRFVLRQYHDLKNRGWLSDDRKVGNGARTDEDFEVDPRFSSTNTDYGGSDPGRVADTKLEATFNPEGGEEL